MEIIKFLIIKQGFVLVELVLTLSMGDAKLALLVSFMMSQSMDVEKLVVLTNSSTSIWIDANVEVDTTWLEMNV